MHFYSTELCIILTDVIRFKTGLESVICNEVPCCRWNCQRSLWLTDHIVFLAFLFNWTMYNSYRCNLLQNRLGISESPKAGIMAWMHIWSIWVLIRLNQRGRVCAIIFRPIFINLKFKYILEVWIPMHILNIYPTTISFDHMANNAFSLFFYGRK